MKKSAIGSLAVLALLGVLVSATWAEVLDPLVTVGTHYLMPNTLTTVPILVSTSEQVPVMVRGLDFYIQAGDGGPVNSNPQHQGTDTMPKITGVDVIGPGTLFYQPSGTQDTWHLPDSGGNYLIWQASTVLPVAEASRAASGTLAYVTIDTTGMSWHDTRTLTIENVAQYVHPELPQGYTTDFGGVPAKLVAGQIIILPEPGTLALLSVAATWAVLLLRRRK